MKSIARGFALFNSLTFSYFFLRVCREKVPEFVSFLFVCNSLIPPLSNEISLGKPRWINLRNVLKTSTFCNFSA